ncbi:MAG: hypothetical protein FRX48_08075 [Lasallia pustulata]|uniref:Uncharacterized protein n=1 Tax=Lasallia pustulata TaxID=136370 RepID=A0A5M8PH12_9LECA|nr:MAG: hypothetical protein FRX48_08075 [Lasallia pustulata]
MAETEDENGIQTRERINASIRKAIKTYEDFDFKDTDLWESFKEDFEDSTEQTFKDASNHEIRRLRTILRKRGAWIQKRARTHNTSTLKGRTPQGKKARLIEEGDGDSEVEEAPEVFKID